VALHPELADAFQNGYRQELAALEREFDLHVEIIASSKLHRSDEEISWQERSPAQSQRQTPPSAGAVGVADLTTTATRSPSPDEPAATGEEPKEGRKKKRRGGRKHRKSPAGQEAPTEETESSEKAQAPAESDEGATEGVDEATGDETPSNTSKRKRKRGGRKHRKSPSGSEASTGTASTDESRAEPAETGAPEEPGEGAGADQNGGEGAAGSKRKRRRGGRRRKKSGGTEATEVGDETPADEPTPEKDPFAY
jgi:ribonuclease E